MRKSLGTFWPATTLYSDSAGWVWWKLWGQNIRRNPFRKDCSLNRLSSWSNIQLDLLAFIHNTCNTWCGQKEYWMPIDNKQIRDKGNYFFWTKTLRLPTVDPRPCWQHYSGDHRWSKKLTSFLWYKCVISITAQRRWCDTSVLSRQHAHLCLHRDNIHLVWIPGTYSGDNR